MDTLNTKKAFKKFNVILPIAFAVVLVLFLLFFDQTEFKNDIADNLSDLVIGFTLLFSSIFAFIKNKTDVLSSKTVIILLLICGFALRLGYIIRYPYDVHQHDVEGLKSAGHLSYIYGIATGDGLPKTNDWQFCHPPLHHFISAGVLKLSWAMGKSLETSFENLQLLTCLYSALTVLVGNLIFKEIGISDKVRVYLVAVLSFHPSMIIFAGSINNDILCVLFVLLAVFFLIKWYKNPTVLSAFFTGLFIGLGMMTKFSASLIAVAAASAVLFRFFTSKTIKFKQLLGHTLAFLGIMLPIGMWYAVRNYMLFGQPLGYVAPIGTDSALYIGDLSVFKRLILPFSLTPTGVYTNVWEEYNLWQYLLRNSLFGEYSFGSESVAVLVVILNICLVVLFFIGTVILIKKHPKLFYGMCPIAVVLVLQMAFFIYFNLRYPYRCSMDFRYIVPVLFCGMAMLGSAAETLQTSDNTLSKIFCNTFKFSAVAFCVCSVAVFI
jgi:hypothetical protein